MDAGYYRMVHDREVFEHSGVFQSEELELDVADKDELLHIVKMLFSHKEYGTVFRVKGYAKTRNEGCYEVNCTGDYIYCEKIETDSMNQKNMIVIIGQHLKYSMFHPTLHNS